MIPALRALIVEPIRKINEEHRKDHALLEYHLEVNGADKELPEKDQGMPLRTLVIRTKTELSTHMRDATAHIRDTAAHAQEAGPLMQQYRHDLEMRGEGGSRRESVV
jgi:hypothetical protein